MPAIQLRPKNSEISDRKAYLKWRGRMLGKLAAAGSVSWLLALACALPEMLGRVHNNHLLTGSVIFFFCVALIFFVPMGHILSLDSQDLSALLEQDSVTVAPVLAEYHAYFCDGQRGKAKAQTLRVRIVELLRSQNEPPTLDCSHQQLISLVRLIAYLEEPDDRRLLLNVIAKSGTPDCFGELDLTLWKIRVWELRKDERAQHTLGAMFNDCKVAIRARNNRLQMSQSLLRASHSSHGLLHPSSPLQPRSDIDNLLHPTTKPEG